MLHEIAKIISRCKKLVVLTGAGISAESGVPTFRGKEGLWGKFKPEQLASMEAFVANPDIVWEWYKWRRELISDVHPNTGHFALVKLADRIDNFTLITQNVDNLHQAAGSTDILELHGNIYKNKCIDCEYPISENIDIDPADIPVCEKCGGKIRPDVVWFGEMLPAGVIDMAFQVSEAADIFMSIGTSAIVQPAASLPMAAKQNGATLIEINPEETPLTNYADYFIKANSGQWLPDLIDCLNGAKETT